MAKTQNATTKAPRKQSSKKLAKAKFYGKTNKLKKSKTAAAKKEVEQQKGAWERVKIAGNLITDDGGGLEGLIGLEVLEDYGAAVVATGGKRTYSDNDLDDDFALLTKNERKKKRQESADKANEQKAEKKAKLRLKEEQKQKKAGAVVKTVAANGAGEDDEEESSENDDDDDDDISEDEDNAEDDNDEDDDDSASDDDAIFNESDVSDIEMEEDIDTETETTVDDLIEWKKLNVNELILKALAEKNFRTPTAIQALTLPSAILDKKDILGAAETGSGKTLAFGIPILNGILELKQNCGESVNPRKVPKNNNGQQQQQQLQIEEEAAATSKKSKKKKHLRNGERDNCTPPRDELLFAPTSDFVEEDLANGTADRPLYALVLTPTRELCVQVKDHLVQAAKYTGIQVVAIFGGLAHVKQERVLRKCPEIVVATPGRLWELIRDGNEHLNKLRDIK